MNNGFFGSDFRRYKPVLFSSLFLVMVMLIGLFGGSYAWYAYTDARTEFEINSGTLEGGVDVFFNTSQYLNVTIGAPILSSEEMRDYIDPNIFTVITPDVAEIALKIEIVDIVFGDNNSDGITLNTSNFKYRLYQNGVNVSEGNFLNISSENSIVIKNMGLMNPNVTYEYKLYVWLADDGACIDSSNYAACITQNALMGESFRGKVQISTIVKVG